MSCASVSLCPLGIRGTFSQVLTIFLIRTLPRLSRRVSFEDEGIRPSGLLRVMRSIESPGTEIQ